MADPPSKLTAGDLVHTLARTGLSAIPGVGGPAAELLNVVIAPPVQRRMLAFVDDLAARLKKLEDEGRLRVEDLAAQDAFLDATVTALRAAAATSQEEKRQALRNAVLNAALPDALDESTQQVFLRLVDEFTPWHLRVLALVQDPVRWAKERSHHYERLLFPSLLPKVIYSAFPALTKPHGFALLVWGDLLRTRLVRDGDIDKPQKPELVLCPWTTSLGDAFLRFIEEPK